jgi:hypothetical protein
MSFQMSDLNSRRRKVLARLFFGGASALALTACGGGGGGDATSDKEEALKAAYYKLENRMVWTDVEALVGFPANHTRYDTDLVWVAGEVRLSVGFTSTGTKLIVAASLRVGSNPAVGRNFTE